MRTFLLSLRSEFYKSRNTLAFWGAVILPFALVLLVSFGFYAKSDRLSGYSGMLLWMHYTGGLLNVMGILLLPILIVFIAYSVHNIEHKAEMWKSLFSLPLHKLGIYTAKYVFAVVLVMISLVLFPVLSLLGGYVLGALNPEQLKFHEYNFATNIWLLYIKLFLTSLGILSIQFFLSLIWSDFIKPMGVGFLGTIVGIMATNVKWEYTYLIPYAHPFLALRDINTSKTTGLVELDFISQEVVVGLSVAVFTFVLGYAVVNKRSVR